MKRICLAFLTVVTFAFNAFAAPGLADSSSSSFAQIRPVGLDEVKWTDGFWAQHFELCRKQTIPALQQIMEGTNHSQFFYNFEILAGMAEGKGRGPSFNDGDFYKFMEAASATLAVTNDPALRDTLDRYIKVIAQAQETGGYLDTHIQLHRRLGDTNSVPFRSPEAFEMYNLGHLMTAACVHARATGETNFLAVARKAADFLCETFKNPTADLAKNRICPSHYMGIIELYRLTREPRYLELAKKWIAMRDLVTDGTADNQDKTPLAKQTEAEGHAVRANYLYAGAADLFLEDGDTNLLKQLDLIWTNVATRKIYITGGCGALYDGAAPDGDKDQKDITRVHQAYGRNYQLPNLTAHNETCANIGNLLWNWRMFLASGEARYVDMVELELFNSILSGGSLDGTNFFYTNPLRVEYPLPVELRWPRERVDFISTFCCPPNLARTVAESASYAYSKTGNAIWVNLYGGSRLETELETGGKIKLSQQTEYPWNGRVRIKILACGANPWTLKLRIPGWADASSVRINDGPADESAKPASYHEIHRTWQAGDVVDVDFPMPVRLVEANPLVEEDANQVAVRRGPIVYCVESTDLPKGIKMADVFIPPDIQLVPRYDKNLLDGVVVLEGAALAGSESDWSGKLYREFQPKTLKPVKLRLIPYCDWDNRGRSEMSVWMPLAGHGI